MSACDDAQAIVKRINLQLATSSRCMLRLLDAIELLEHQPSEQERVRIAHQARCDMAALIEEAIAP